MARRSKEIFAQIPGFGDRRLRTMICDYTGTLSYRGDLVDGVKERLIQLATMLDIHIVTADSHATAKKHLGGLRLKLNIIKTDHQDSKKREYLDAFNPEARRRIREWKQ